MNEKVPECSPTEDRASELGSYRRRGLILRLSPQVAASLRTGTFGRDTPTLVLFHEHMHLVQDTTTLYGAMAHLAHWAKLQSIANANAAADRIRLPILQPQGRAGTLDAQSESRWASVVEGAWGTDDVGPCEVLSVALDPACTSRFADGKRVNEFPTPTCTLTISRTGRSPIEYAFGGAAVREGLAALMECSLTRDHPGVAVVKSPMPYDVLRLVALRVARDAHAEPPDDFTLARLAERSLMTLAPGYFMYRYVDEHLRRPGHELDEVIAAADEREGFASMFAPLGLQSRVLDNLEEYARNFSVSPQKARAFSWFLDRLRAGLQHRARDPDHFIRPMAEPDPWGAYAGLVSESPVPLVEVPGERNLFNVDPNATAGDAATEAGMLFALLDYVADLHVRRDRPVACPLRDACTMTFRDELCASSPWSRTRDDPTCVVGSAFAMLGVKDKRVKSYHKDA